MAKFTDREGDDWLVELDTGTLKEIKKTLGSDLLDLQGTFFTQVLTDDVLLVDVLYVACRRQAEKRDIDDENFGRRLGKGEVIEQATDALIEAMTDFFPPRRRAVLQAAIRKHKELEEKMLQRSMAMLDNGRIEALLEKRMQEIESEFLTPAESGS